MGARSGLVLGFAKSKARKYVKNETIGTDSAPLESTVCYFGCESYLTVDVAREGDPTLCS